MQGYKVLIVEDEPIIAEHIAICLEEIAYQIAGTAYTSDEAFEILQQEQVDLVLLDIDLGEKMDGVDIAHRLNAEFKLPFVFLTSFADRLTLDRVKETFPAGYIVKPFNKKDLFAALELASLRSLPPSTTPNTDLKAINQKIPTAITDREFEVLKLMMEGASNKQMAEKLYVSTNTVKTHLSNIYAKLGVGSRTQAMAAIKALDN